MGYIRQILGLLLTLLVSAMCVVTYQYVATHPRGSVARDYRPPERGGKGWPAKVTRTIEGLGAPYRIEALPTRIDGTCYVYVADRDRATVSVIDSSTDTIVEEIDCGSAGVPVVLGAGPRSSEMLVGMANEGGGRLGRIQPIADFRELGLVASPACLAFRRDYVMVFDGATRELLCLSHLALAGGSTATPSAWSVGEKCLDLAPSEDEGTVFLALSDSRRIVEVNATPLCAGSDAGQSLRHADIVERTFSLTGEPCGLALDELEKRLFVSLLDGGVACVDLWDEAVRSIDTRAGELGCRWMDMAPRGDHLYVTNYADGSVSVIDVRAERTADRIPVGKGPSDVAVTVDYKVYVANTDDGTISVLE